MGAASAGGAVALVEVGNSASYNGTDEFLDRTPSSASNRDLWTYSLWVNRSKLLARQQLIQVYPSVPDEIEFIATDALSVQLANAATTLVTTRLFQDTNAWIHIVIIYNSLNALASERCRLYINGVRETDFSTETYPSSGQDSATNSTESHRIGNYSSFYYGGYMAELVLIDGVAQPPTSFGEFDSTGLYWTPLASATIKALTFGTNGFYLDNTTNAQTDASGNGNNFTNNNTVTTTTHTPTNSAALLNPLQLVPSGQTLSLNNTRITGATGGFLGGLMTTLPCDSGGKWYWESRVRTLYTTNGYHAYGVAPANLKRTTDAAERPGVATFQGGSIFFRSAAYTDLNSNSNAQNTNVIGSMTISVGNIVQLAFDAATQKLWYGINNTWYNSGNPATGANPSSTLTATDDKWYPWFGMYQPEDSDDVNMGTNPTFNGAVTAQNNADGNGEGNFYYAPPTGFLAINTNNIAAETTRTASDTNKYFQTTLYEGNGAGQRVGAFQPFDNTFTVANSALFQRANSESLSKTPSGAGSSTTTGTFNVWIKQGLSLSNRAPLIYADGASSDFQMELNIDGNNKLRVDLSYSGANHIKLSTQAFEDASQWSMVTCILDTSNGTASERIRLYWNGNRIALTTDNAIASSQAIIIGSAVEHQIGAYETSYYYDGYMSEVVYTDGQAYEPSSFGQVDTSTNRWIPKDVSGLTFGTNGFYLNFAASGDVGNDVSGNNNDFTNNNTVVQTTDSPTTNFAVLDPNVISGGAVTLSAGNLTQTGGATTVTCNVFATLPMRSGKWIMAGRPNLAQNYEQAIYVANETGVAANTTRMDQDTTGNFIGLDISTLNALETQQGAGVQNVNISPSLVGGTDYTVLAMDADNKKVYIGWHDVSGSTTYWLGNDRSTWNGNPATGAGAFSIAGSEFKFVTASYSGRGGTVDFGQGTFLSNVTIPTGYLALSQDNMAGTDQFISAFSWIKNRDATDNHMLFDRVRGATKDLHSNTSDVEVTNVNTVQRFLEAGVQVGNDVEVNTANESYVLWNWMMENTGSGASNEDGSINTTSTLVDQTLGLSISKYTGTGANATVGHGLGVAPGMIIIKRRDTAGDWLVYNSAIAATNGLKLNVTDAKNASVTYFNNTEPTSSVFSIGTNPDANASSSTYVAYCFAPSQFISIGSYEGNGNANGTFVPTLNSLGVPIQPVWAITKSIDSTSNWDMYDKERLGYNPENAHLDANDTVVESTADNLDIVTGGLKMRIATDPNVAETYVYMAIGTPIIDVDGRIIAGR